MADLTPKPTGKSRASRIRLDHYRAWDPLTRARWALTGLAVAVALPAVVWALTTSRGSVVLSHGPLSRPHATWESRCDVCHLPGTPLRMGSVALHGMDAASQTRCQTCHAVAPHRSLAADLDQRCAACHTDHRGLDNDLTLVSDASCTVCHADTGRMARDSAAPGAQRVGHFPGDHPPFRSLPSDPATGDPGALAFSHSRHMRAGLVTSPGANPTGALRYDGLPPEALERYLPEGADPSSPVQLGCAACHELRRDTEGLSVAAAGVFLPIEYDRHCQACHPLPFGAGQTAQTLPHGLRPDAIDDHLTRALRSAWFEGEDPALQQELRRPTPGRSRLLRAEVVSAAEALDSERLAARRGLADRCAQCHEPDPGAPGDPFAVAPTNVTTRWLKNARFDHTAHRAIDCLACHAAAAGGPSPPADLAALRLESRAVMVPGMDNCAQCHAPKLGLLGGVRHDCAACHRYHESGASLAGAPAHPPQVAPRAIDSFLLGETNDAPPE